MCIIKTYGQQSPPFDDDTNIENMKIKNDFSEIFEINKSPPMCMHIDNKV